MSDILDVFFRLLIWDGACLTFVVFFVFLAAYYRLLWRCDFHTAMELATLAWFVALMKATGAIMAAYRVVASSDVKFKPPMSVWMAELIGGTLPLISAVVLLSAPIAWAFWQSKPNATARANQYMLLAALMAFLNVLVLLVLLLALGVVLFPEN